jgi:hypothetical protein
MKPGRRNKRRKNKTNTQLWRQYCTKIYCYDASCLTAIQYIHKHIPAKETGEIAIDKLGLFYLNNW